jgi:hypothetical protein
MKCAIQRASSLFCFLSFLVLAPTVWAQYGSSLQGTISDQSGAAVAGSTVTATNQATGVSNNTQTNDSGFYRISGLPPGNYKVVVEAASFKQGTAADVVVAAEAVRGLNIPLQPGGVQETVTVIATGEALQTENASVTGTRRVQPTETHKPFRSRLAREVQTVRYFRQRTRFRRSPMGSGFPRTTICWMESV